MQLKEILSIEENHTEDSRAVIHLFQEGSFYRAYEWSAWLCHRFINQFKVTHRNQFVSRSSLSLQRQGIAYKLDVL